MALLVATVAFGTLWMAITAACAAGSNMLMWACRWLWRHRPRRPMKPPPPGHELHCRICALDEDTVRILVKAQATGEGYKVD